VCRPDVGMSSPVVALVHSTICGAHAEEVDGGDQQSRLNIEGHMDISE
jgi:hypothetical protein